MSERQYERNRDEFLHIAKKEGLSKRAALLFLRHANTLKRYAVYQCNGDWPAEGEWLYNRDKQLFYCAECEGGWSKEVKRKGGICPDCSLSKRVKQIAEAEGCVAILNGDPRGAVVKIKVPSGYSNSWSGEGICVPTRYY